MLTGRSAQSITEMRPRVHSILDLHGAALPEAERRREPAEAKDHTAESLVRLFASETPKVTA